ncbi:uncharacterized protein DS421_11g324910 [Arachis hypogaea]|nr:uncharacterized protein DS421_11g324910 [Arachis hypogaea]
MLSTIGFTGSNLSLAFQLPSPSSAAAAETTTVTTPFHRRQPFMLMPPSSLSSPPSPPLRRHHRLPSPSSATTVTLATKATTCTSSLISFSVLHYRLIKLDMSKGRGAANQTAGRGRSHGRGRGRISSSTPGTFGSSLSTPTTPVMPQESSHKSEAAADAPPLPPIVRLKIWPNGCIRWDAEHDLTIKKIFDHRMGRRLKQMLNDVRQGQDHRTTWLQLDIMMALYVHWETDEGFQHRCLTNRANRPRKSSKYTGSLATFMKTKSKSLDPEATLTETFKYTHALKENKETFADQQEDATDGSAASVVDPDVVWCKTALAPYKNCVYGVGWFFTSSLCTSTLRSLSSSATSRARGMCGFEAAIAGAPMQPSAVGS